MKELLPFRREDGSVPPTSRVATTVLRLLSQVWRTGYTPPQRRRATVVSVHKKGGPADTDSYTGVSLTPAPFNFFKLWLLPGCRKRWRRKDCSIANKLGSGHKRSAQDKWLP